MEYISTRGRAPRLDFEHAVLAGLATDGGLYVPAQTPQLQDIEALKDIPYAQAALRVLQPFVGDSFTADALAALLEAAYATFRHPEVAPLSQIGDNEYLLELFHGPTLAFKDFALQFLGRVLDALLQRRGERIVILGATSGDTGSAAIAGCRGRGNMDIVILFPKGRVSDVQRRQMTTVEDANVHAVAVEGTFDDCQNLVKTLFNDIACKTALRLAAVNSINWARVAAQIVYYFTAAAKFGASPVRFTVPTGNFGDIYAGYEAAKMGLAVEKLVIATNRNDILHRCLATGRYSMEGVHPSLSPSMDIQISSNFERLLFDLYNRDGAKIDALMQEFRQRQSFTLTPDAWAKLKTQFASARADDALTLQTIRAVYEATGNLIDPHTAVGVAAARQVANPENIPSIILATAHAAKFPDAVKKATGQTPELPPHMAGLMEKKERFETLPNDAEAVKKFIQKNSSPLRGED